MASTPSAKKRKIAILGGGMGALSAAYALTSDPNWRDRLEVTIYQRGWRLGGKAASGRNMALHGRVEGHGMHVWSGSFGHAIAMMQDCYQELVGRGLRSTEAVLGTFDKAFKPLNHLFIPETVTDPDGKPETQPWRIDAPSKDGEAHALETPGILTPKDCLESLLILIAATLADAGGDPALLSSPSGSANIGLVRSWLDEARKASSAATIAQRRRLLVLDISLAAANGIIEDLVLAKGFDHLDQWEGRVWLARHGASAEAIASTALAAAYGFAFGYPGSLNDERGIGAGTLLHNLCRVAFAAPKTLFYTMQAGAGDAVFAPLYEVLKARGVEFRFFHATTGLHLNDTSTAIEAVGLVEQAKSLSAYEPLVTVRNLPSWPSQPLWEQLEGGRKLAQVQANFEDELTPSEGRARRLCHGIDFDDIVLGISLGALAGITPALAKASPAWNAMLTGIETAAVQTAQLWLTVPSAEYGWKQLADAHNPDKPSGNAPLRTLTAGLAGRFNAWSDTSDLLARADWGFDDRPWSAATFTGLLPEPALGPAPGLVLHDIAHWLESDLPCLWPNMQTNDSKFLYTTLHDPGGRPGRDRLGWQYSWTGDDGSARQILSTPGSLDKRLAPDASGFANLYLAGDWTRNGINAASAESATQSGVQAANAIIGQGR